MIPPRMRHRHYFDHAATSFPKPDRVLDRVAEWQREIGSSAGRGAYEEASGAARVLLECRRALCRVLGVDHPERLVFTSNATSALNLGLKGLLRPGDHVVTSAVEHNSVLRPLNALVESRGITISRLPAFSTGEIDAGALRKAITPRTALIVVQQASNVSGAIQPLAAIAAVARGHGVPVLVDAAQSAGSLAVEDASLALDMIAVPGHKGLLGPQGTGALWVRPGLELDTFVEGGTGSLSERESQPLEWPDRHEAGSHNMPGLAGLLEGVGFLEDVGLSSVRGHKRRLTGQLLEGLAAIDDIHVVGQRAPEMNAGVVSFVPSGSSPQEFARRLDADFRVQARPGLHCAPGAHQAIGSFPSGTVRLSVGFSNTEDDVAAALHAIQYLCARKGAILTGVSHD
ncbi:MAG: aminotransferase class V-fold PLP-dependent enzyme [Sumerlaeia bacterium]